MRESREIAVGFGSPVFRILTGLANGAANEHLADAIVGTNLRERQGVRVDRYFDAVNVEGRRARWRFGVICLPEVQLVRRSLENLNYVDGSLRVVASEWTAGRVVPTALKVGDRLCNDAVHRCTVSQAFRDSSLGVLVLDDERSVLARIFRLPQDSHLAYRCRSDEIVSKLRRGKPRVRSLLRRSGHG